METGNIVIDKWSALKLLVEDLELHVVKNSRGVAAAGVRARKGLRELKDMAADLVKHTVERDKAAKLQRPKRSKKTLTEQDDRTP